MNLGGWVTLGHVALLVYFTHGVDLDKKYLTSRCRQPDRDVYGFTLPHIDGNYNISLSDYKDKVLLVVNTATYSGKSLFHNKVYFC